MKVNKGIFFIVIAFIAALVLVAIFGLPLGDFELKGIQDMRYGIDIRGGVEAIFEPKDLNRMPTASELDSARAIIERRLDAQNILDRVVTTDNQNGHILVRFPFKSSDDGKNPAESIAELGETAYLSFREGNQVADGPLVIDGSHVISATVEQDQNTRAFQVALKLNSDGAALFGEATSRLIQQTITIYMDDSAISWPTVQSAITDGNAVITGMGGREEAKLLADRINAGALPFSMHSTNNTTISPTLGRGALDVMILAGIIAFILVCIFMLVYYRLPGFVACFALTLQVVGQLLALSIPQITLTLGGIAGLVLSIGMGVDANVITSERIKEELRGDRTLASAISSGFHKAFSSVFDGNITVIIVAIIMMIFGSGSMLSFAYSLLTGVILNFLAGITASRLMIKSLSQFDALKNPVLYGGRRATK